MSTTEEKISSTVHKLFVVSYSVCTCLAILVSVSSGVVTDYWKESIDGCILYADFKERKPARHIPKPKFNNTFNNSDSVVRESEGMDVIASDISVCNYATFTPVFFIFICMACVAYHVRNLFFKHCWREEESETRNEFWEMVVRILVGVSSFMTFLALVVACILTHGHDYTCSRLRSYVSLKSSQILDFEFLRVNGFHEDRVHDLIGRLDCGFFYSVLDFGFDELENPLSELHDLSSSGRSTIDSQVALETAMATGWLQFFCWLGITVANFWLANRLSIKILPDSIPIPALPAFFNKE